MSEKTEAPALLSPEQVEEMRLSNAGQQAAAKIALRMGAPVAKQLLASTQRVDALLADRLAYRTTVAEQLLKLRDMTVAVSDSTLFDAIEAAARTLSIDL